MYACAVKEFATDARVNVADASVLVFVDKYHFCDQYLHPVFTLEKNTTDVGCFPEIWVNAAEGDKTVAQQVSTRSWSVDATRDHAYYQGSVAIDDKIFVVQDVAEGEAIVAYDNTSTPVQQVLVDKLYSGLLAHQNHVYAAGRDGSAYCFDADLTQQWQVKNKKATHSANATLRDPVAYGALVIFNAGEDKGGARGNFEINAYRADSGELVWQKILPTSPDSSHLVDGNLYVCAAGRCLKIAADTGVTEWEMAFAIDGAHVSAVYPVAQGLLCFNQTNSIVELRSHGGLSLLQTIVLPETYAYHLSVKPPVIEHEGNIYFALGHVVMGLNALKAAVAVLTPDARAGVQYQALLEQRPPYQVDNVQDAAGKHAYRVRMRGSDPHHIIRYAHILLKELAFASGVNAILEFDTRDPENAGTLLLEISTQDLGDGSGLSWQDFFAVIKTRVENDLNNNRVLAGDGKSQFRVELSVS